MPIARLSGSFQLKEISEAVVLEQLFSLKVNKAIGLDNISARLLKCGAQSISHSITKLINLSIRSGKFPGIWKCSKVTALFKSGDRTNATNYRPISILPTLSKILERVIHSQLYEHLASNNLLSNKQLGFRPKRSTATALTGFADEILLNMERGNICGAVFLDLTKAFDTVDHGILMSKLSSVGVSPRSLEWFARRFPSFLHWLLEARRFASFPNWLLEARRFASFLYWLLEAKRFASFTQTTIHVLWAWKREVSLPSPVVGSERFRFLPPLVVGSETFRFLPPLVVGSETFRFLPPLVVGSETFRFFYPNNNTYIVGVEARRFASFPHWLLEARRFASFLYWLLEAKRFASFTQTTIHILWAWKRDVSLPSPIGCWKRDVSLPSPIGCWKRDVSLPSPIGCWKRDVSLPSSIGCWKRNVSLLLPKQQYIYCGRGSETFRFLSPLATEAERFASARTIMERTTRFQKHIMFEGILSHIMPSANCPF